MNDSFSENCDNDCEGGLIFGLVVLGLPTLVLLYSCCCMCYNDARSYIIKNRKRKKVVVFENKLTPNYIKILNSNFKEGVVNTECSICLSEVKVSKQKTICLPCHHGFHEKCLQEWIKPNVSQGIEPGCPICRKIIVKRRITNLNYDDHAELEV